MSTDARSEIFARLRKASTDASANDILRESWALGHAPYPPLPCESVEEAFLINVLKNRGTVDHAEDRSAAVKAIAHYLYTHYRTQRFVAGNDPRLAAMPWRDAGLLPRFGTLEPGEPFTLSYARLGIAELGATASWTGKSNPSANNLLAEHHIALVNSEDIVATTEDAWARIQAAMDENGRPRGINFVAGPSSTADIEGQLIYGAHGPRAWHVIVIGILPDDALSRARTNAAA